MLTVALHYDRDTRTESLVIQAELTRLLGALHLAAYVGTHAVRYMSGLPAPRGLYFLVHDLTEPPLRRWCERHPRPARGELSRMVWGRA